MSALSELKVSWIFSEADDAFASKPAPTGDLCTAQIPCGSGLAREEARKSAESLKIKPYR
ncbi:hypothetical protein C1X64_11565 [Pseudomonas sp. GW456-E7]|nr:hypothetical protein C1X64_11565 [Pseudomonas sp. GW456-E7]